MTDVLQALTAARRALREADDAAACSVPSPAFADLIEAALSAVDLAIEEASPQQARRAVTVPPAGIPTPHPQQAR